MNKRPNTTVVSNSKFLEISSKLLQSMPIGRRTVFSVLHSMVGKPHRFIIDIGNELMFPVDCHDKDVALKVALNKAYEPVVGALFLSKCNSGDVVWDVGANKGYYTLLAQQKVGIDGKVFAYEPAPENVIDLDLIKSLNNLENFIVEPSGISSSVGEASFILEGWSDGVSAWGKLINGNVDSSDERVTVPTTTIDHEIERNNLEKVDMIKMDIQGGEVGAIEGGKEALKERKIKNILLELHDMQLGHDECHEIINTLLNSGFTGKAIDQDEIPDKAAINSIESNIPLNISSYGIPAQNYDWNKRRNVNHDGQPTDDYVKPLQFLLSLS